MEESPDIPHVTESRVERILAKLNPSKVSGPDQIRNWLLKEYSDLVAFPVTEILNASVNEPRLPAMSLLCQRRNSIGPLGQMATGQLLGLYYLTIVGRLTL